jgi:hypothetical protein
MLRGLRSDDPAERLRAAHEIDRTRLFPPAFTAALVRATARRDMAAREGFTLALEQSQAANADPVAVLRQLAETTNSAEQKAFARAALRSLQATH